MIFESHILGFCIGFVSIYHHFTYVLLALLAIHIIGTLYTERRFDLIGNTFAIIIECLRLVFKGIHGLFSNRSSPKVVVSKKIPQEYLYNYRLKPSTDHRLEQVRGEKNEHLQQFQSDEFRHYLFNQHYDQEFSIYTERHVR